jgi:hypothetical protein
MCDDAEVADVIELHDVSEKAAQVVLRQSLVQSPSI